MMGKEKATLDTLYFEARPEEGFDLEVSARVWQAQRENRRMTRDAVIELRRKRGGVVEVARYLATDLSEAQLARRAIELIDGAATLPVDVPLPASSAERMAMEAELARALSDLATLKLAARAAVEILDNVDMFTPATEKTLRRDIEEAGDKLCRALEGIAPDPEPVY